MGDRLTPKREAEIRQPRTRRLDWAPQVYEEWDDERDDLIAELDAVRAERDAARVERLRAVRESEAHSLVRTELHRQLGHHMAQGAMVESLTERALAAEARVRELEKDHVARSAALMAAERQVHRLIHGQEIEGDRLCSHELEAIPLRDRVRELEAERAALRAQLATLREAWRRYDRSCAPTAMQDPDARAAWDRAIAALAEPGPTLASIEAGACMGDAEVTAKIVSSCSAP